MTARKKIWVTGLVCMVALLATTAAQAQMGTGTTQGGQRTQRGAQPPGSTSQQGVLGACCLSTGGCIPNVSVAFCQSSLAGVYQGDGTTCAEVTCAGFGACCFGGEICQTTSGPECELIAGNYQGNSMKCSQIGICGFTSGACCLSDGGCQDNIDFEECEILGGVYRGFYTECADVECQGACSFNDGACFLTSADACAGNFIGPDSSCIDLIFPAVAQCVPIVNPQDEVFDVDFQKFDTLGGSRVLQRVTFEVVNANVSRVVEVRNVSDVTNFSTPTFDFESLQVEFSELSLSEFIINETRPIACTPPLLPPQEQCNYGGPVIFEATRTSASSVDDLVLLDFIGPGTVTARFSGVGETEINCSNCQFANVANVSGKVRIIYEYLATGACCVSGAPCAELIEPDCERAGGLFQGARSLCADTDCPQACCLPDGTCLDDVTAAACAATPGAAQGDGTTCATLPLPCRVPEGACCFPDGSCQDLIEEDCVAANGSFLGDDTMCVSETCPQPGACCLSDGSCVLAGVLGGADCAGVYQGDDTICADVMCPQPGACCLSDGSCVLAGVLGGADCAGDYQGDDTICADASCPEGCCLTDGTCIEVTASICTLQGGVPQNDTCANSTCPQPGACCLSDGSCVLATVVGGADCAGVYQGDDTICANVTCPMPGACCLDDGSCVLAGMLGGADCAGVYQGDDTICANVTCPMPGACCLSDGSCVLAGVLGGADCAGDYQGDDTICANVSCPEGCCLADGTCIEVTAASCTLQGGAPQDDTCANSTCPQPGACCLSDGSCVLAGVLGGADCAGDYQGDDTICADVSCPEGCCLEDGTCIEVTASICNLQGGTPQNDTCANSTCDQPGACCLSDGSCVQSTVLGGADCAGVYQGDGTTCATVTCPMPGACCLDDGSCVLAGVLGGADCAGDYQGDDTICADVDCPEGCCLMDGTCVEVTAAACLLQDGLPQNDTCANSTCDQPGACCLADGTCVQSAVRGGADCAGIYQGDNTVCANVTCIQPGACCLPDGSCVQATGVGGVGCTGDYQGDDTLCADVECPEGCCLTDGTCVTLPATQCVAGGGQPQGDSCANVTCPVQACCLDTGACIERTAEACVALGGVPQGVGSSCATSNCDDPPQREGCSEKGSLIIFSKVDIRWDAQGQLTQDTFIQLTNDRNQEVRVRLYFVNGDEPLAADPENGEPSHPGWNYANNGFVLTGNQTVSWSAVRGGPTSPFTVLDPSIPGRPGRPCPENPNERCLRGFIYGWAVNSQTEEIKWNHLSGTATILNYRNNHAWSYNACTYQAVNDALAEGEQTGDPGKLNLDGEEYAFPFNALLFDFFAAGSDALSIAGSDVVVQGDLTLHPVGLDVRQENEGPILTKASFDVWNSQEIKFSELHQCVNCWDERLFTQYGSPNWFLIQNLGTDVGKARIDGHGSSVCDIDFDPNDGMPVGNDPRDRLAVPAPLTGVGAKIMSINNVVTMAAGTNLIGSGTEAAMIQYDLTSPSEELNGLPELPASPTAKDIDAYMEAMLEFIGAAQGQDG